MLKKLKRILLFLLALPLMLAMGAIKVKSSEASAEKWDRNASSAAEAYRVGAEAAAQDWAAKTAAAGDTFHQAVSAPSVKTRFVRGVQRAGAEKYARKIRDVGGDRFGPGVAAARSDYQTGVEPFLQTISGLTLSTRKPRGDPANYRRVEEVGKALNAKRLAMLGAS